MKGVVYWNSHAFKLTKLDGVTHVEQNYEFTTDQRYTMTGLAAVVEAGRAGGRGLRDGAPGGEPCGAWRRAGDGRARGACTLSGDVARGTS